MTEGEFKLWCKNTKALSQDAANEWWTELYDNESIDRDNKGRGGLERLWVPTNESRETLNE
eukprot:324683-Alexandrium_andersonii.AAC.1